MDALTAVNLFIGHATGAVIVLLFVWLLASEVFVRGAIRRSRMRWRRHRPDPAAARDAKTAETVSTLSFQ